MGDVVAIPVATWPSFGAYDTFADLGAGGMGRVYVARSRETGLEIAIKTVEGSSPGALAALRVEVSTLRRIDHPGIVKIVAEGLHAARPWYGMTLVRGERLSSYLDRLFGRETMRDRVTDTTATGAALVAQSVPPERGGDAAAGWQGTDCAGGKMVEVLTIFRKLSDSIAHLHRRGIVHRDIKPSNVVLASEASPVLLDFGLASRWDSALGRHPSWRDGLGRVAGTLPYLAPEILAGRVPDTRADLYSLGCMLYEAVVGRAHGAHDLLERSTVPSAAVAGVPPILDRLVFSLLEKEPRRRLGYAEDVIEVLDALLVEATEAPGLLKREPWAAPVQVLRPTFTGRQRSFDEIHARIRRAQTGHGGVTLLHGESGIGKTFLAAELALAAGRDGFMVLAGSTQGFSTLGGTGDAATTALPLAAFAELLEALADRHRTSRRGPSPPLSEEDLLVLAPFDPSLASIGAAPGPAVAPMLAGDIAGDRVLLAMEHALIALAKDAPLLVVLEDLQWADRLTGRLLAKLPALTRTQRIHVLGTIRDEPGDPRPSGLAALEDVERVRLASLGNDEIRTAAADMLAMNDLPEDLARFLVDHTAGNPLFVAEYLRSAITAGLLTRKDGRWTMAPLPPRVGGSGLPLPDSLQDLLRGRITQLAEPTAGVLAAAAVLGPNVDLDLLERLTPEGTDMWSAIADLREGGLLDPQRGPTLRFVHGGLREAIYRWVSVEERSRLHCSAARALEERTAEIGSNASPNLQIALHWAAAGEDRQAWPRFEAAAERARHAGANADAAGFVDAAVQHLRRAIASNGAQLEGDLCRLLTIAAELRLTLGRSGEARAEIDAALTLPTSNQQRAHLLRIRAATHVFEKREIDVALALLAEAETLLGDRHHDDTQRSAWIDLLCDRAWTLYWPGRVDELQELIDGAGAVVLQHGSPIQQTRFLQCVVLVELRRRRYIVDEDLLARCETALSMARAAGSLVDSLSAQFGLGFARLLAGEAERAAAILDDVARKAEHSADNATALRARAYLSVAHRHLGDVERARVTALGLMDTTVAPHLVHYRGLAHANLGWTALRIGDLAVARAQLRQALELWHEARPPYPFMGHAALPLLAVAAHSGDAASAKLACQTLLRPDQQALASDLHLAAVAIADSRGDRDTLDLLDVLIKTSRSALER